MERLFSVKMVCNNVSAGNDVAAVGIVVVVAVDGGDRNELHKEQFSKQKKATAFGVVLGADFVARAFAQQVC